VAVATVVARGMDRAFPCKGVLWLSGASHTLWVGVAARVVRRVAAADMYWDKCTSTTIVWAGGVCGTQMQPGVMDWGVAQRAFFTDLSTKPGDPGYALADTFMGKMAADSANNPTPFMVMGWHSYCKDYEHTFTTLTSKHGGRVHGLNTNPNLSFSHQIKLPPGYRFHNRHSPPIPPNATAPHKVNVVLVQTDGLGLGAWTKPGRGTLPYAWEVSAGPGVARVWLLRCVLTWLIPLPPRLAIGNPSIHSHAARPR